MMRRIAGVAVAGLALAGWGCGDGSDAVLNAPQAQVWVSMTPHQCGSPPWEQAGTDVVDYYGALGVTIHDTRVGTIAEVVCSGCACPRGDRIDVLVDESRVAFMLDEGFMLVSASGGIDCSIVLDKLDHVLESIQSCSDDRECGQTLPTSCGCTRDLVARRDADPDLFFHLVATGTRGLCEIPLGPDTCDCPPADGFVCVDSRCAWNYL